MKLILQFSFFFTTVLLITSCSNNQSVVLIPAKQSVEIDYPNLSLYRTSFQNKSINRLDVTVLSKQEDAQIRGFGLGPKGKEDILIEKENKLVIQNNNNSNATIKIRIKEENIVLEDQKARYIKFTLHNTSDKSIPLIIPTVMNPNLSPQSKSGVTLKKGQEIFFKVSGKKHLLIQVDGSIENGEIIDVPELIKKRKAELELK